jgi:hypothetical protein
MNLAVKIRLKMRKHDIWLMIWAWSCLKLALKMQNYRNTFRNPE